MEVAVRKYNEIKAENNWTAEYNTVIDSKKNAYEKLLNRKYKKNVLKNFEQIVELIRPQKIVKNTIYFKSVINGKIEFIIADKTFNNERRFQVLKIINQSITPLYLLHFLGLKQVKEYLELHIYRSIIPHFNFNVLKTLKIPLPKKFSKKVYNNKTITFGNDDTGVRKLASKYYKAVVGLNE